MSDEPNFCVVSPKRPEEPSVFVYADPLSFLLQDFKKRRDAGLMR